MVANYYLSYYKSQSLDRVNYFLSLIFQILWFYPKICYKHIINYIIIKKKSLTVSFITRFMISYLFSTFEFAIVLKVEYKLFHHHFTVECELLCDYFKVKYYTIECILFLVHMQTQHSKGVAEYHFFKFLLLHCQTVIQCLGPFANLGCKLDLPMRIFFFFFCVA